MAKLSTAYGFPKWVSVDVSYLQSTLHAIRMLVHSVQYKGIAFKEYLFTCNLGLTINPAIIVAFPIVDITPDLIGIIHSFMKVFSNIKSWKCLDDFAGEAVTFQNGRLQSPITVW